MGLHSQSSSVSVHFEMDKDSEDDFEVVTLAVLVQRSHDAQGRKKNHTVWAQDALALKIGLNPFTLPLNICHG